MKTLFILIIIINILFFLCQRTSGGLIGSNEPFFIEEWSRVKRSEGSWAYFRLPNIQTSRNSKLNFLFEENKRLQQKLVKSTLEL